MYKLTAPAEGFTGHVGPVPFANGVATTDNEAVVAFARRRGYKVEPVKAPAKGRKAAPAKGDTKTPDDGGGQGDSAPFDPSAHNVDDVLAYLAEADDDERARVLAVEADGQARSTVLGKDGD